MNKIIYILFLILANHLSAQTAFVANGGSTSSTNGSVSYSIGQLAIHNSIGTNIKINEGVQQPFEFYVLKEDTFDNIALEIKLYPNPTASNPVLSIKNIDLKNLSYTLYDTNGKLIDDKNITTQETNIDLYQKQQAIYFLNVNQNNKVIKSFKIIKNQ